MYEVVDDSWWVSELNAMQAMTASVQVRVTQVLDLSSRVELVNKNDQLRFEEIIRAHGPAVRRTRALPVKSLARLKCIGAMTVCEKFQGLLRSHLAKTPSLTLEYGNDTSRPLDLPVVLNIVIDNRGLADIQDAEGKPLPRLPLVNVSDDNAARELAGLLWQALRSQAVLKLEYGLPPPTAALWRANFTFCILDVDEKALLAESPTEVPFSDYHAREYRVEAGDEMFFQFENEKCDRAVYVFIFCFDDSYSIKPFDPIPGESAKKLEQGQVIQVPVKAGTSASVKPTDPAQTVEAFRAYVYCGDHPPPWEELQLPAQSDASIWGDQDEPRAAVFGRAYRPVADQGRWTYLDIKLITTPHLDSSST